LYQSKKKKVRNEMEDREGRKVVEDYLK